MPYLEHQVKAGRDRPGRSGQNGAFTLIELLVSIAVLSILIVLVAAVLNQVSSTWTLISSQIDRHQNGRSILAMIASDLRPATLPIDRSNLYNLQMLADPSVLIGATSPSYSGGATSSTGGGYLNAHAIFWQAPIATGGTGGNMAEVGYFVRWVNPTSSNPRAILCRFFVNPGDPNYLIYSNPTAWLTPAILDSAAPGYNSTATTVAQVYPASGWFADNVIGLWVRCLDANGVPLTEAANTQKGSSATLNYSYDSRLGYDSFDPSSGSVPPPALPKTSYRDGSVSKIAGYLAEQPAVTLPNTVEIAIVVIDARTAARVTAVPSYPQAHTISPSLGFKSPASPYSTNNDSPVDFWNDINNFIANLPPLVAHGAHVYAIRVPIVNGG